MRYFAWVFVILGLLCGSAFAQPTPPPGSNIGGNATLSASSASSNVAFPASLSQFQFVQLINDGAVEAFIAQGNSSVVATTSSIPVPAGSSTYFWIQPGNTNIAAITSAGTTTVRVLQWNGPPNFSSGGSAAVGSTPNSNTALQAVGSVSFQFTVTSSDQAITGLTLPGKICFTNPQQAFGSASSNTSYVNINWNGNASTGSGAIDQIPPGVGDVCWYDPNATAPHVSTNGGSASTVIGVQQ